MDETSRQRSLPLLCSLLALGLPSLTSAQETGRLVGRVIDAQTGQPLVSVQVFSEGPSEGGVGSLTSLEGRYVLRSLPAGFHDITVQLGFFEAVDFVGAADPDAAAPWYAGWTTFATN